MKKETVKHGQNDEMADFLRMGHRTLSLIYLHCNRQSLFSVTDSSKALSQSSAPLRITLATLKDNDIFCEFLEPFGEHRQVKDPRGL